MMVPKKTANDEDQLLWETDIIVAEYNYIAQTAFQANEDRAKVSQFFFVVFGTFLAALLSSQFNNVDLDQIFIAFTIVFFILYLLGVLTTLQLARFRQSWIESVLAMNQIKEQAIKQFPIYRNFFRWRTDSIPPGFKIKSVGFLLAFSVSLISGFSLGSSLAFYYLSRGLGSVPWFHSIFFGIAGIFILIIFFYWLPLRISRNKDN